MKKKVLGLIDGQSGNIGSIKKAIKDLINEKPYQLKIIQGNFNPNNFDKIILPGQGAYATLISNLKKLKIIRPLKQYLDDNKSYLGICVGMQILSDEGHEDQITKGLGIISGKIKKFSNKKLIIPHMGWNTISVNKADPIVKKNLNESPVLGRLFYAELLELGVYRRPGDTQAAIANRARWESAVYPQPALDNRAALWRIPISISAPLWAPQCPAISGK